jgi:dihydrofolate reductase
MDEIQVSIAPVLLGSGVRLFDQLGTDPINLEQIRSIASDGVTYVRYRVLKY